MADTFKTLAQVALSATTLTDVYTVPGATSAQVYATICNRGATSATFRVSIALAGAANDNKQYLFYDEPLNPNSTYLIPHRGLITLSTTDVLRFYASTANISVNVLGLEIT